LANKAVAPLSVSRSSRSLRFSPQLGQLPPVLGGLATLVAGPSVALDLLDPLPHRGPGQSEGPRDLAEGTGLSACTANDLGLEHGGERTAAASPFAILSMVGHSAGGESLMTDIPQSGLAQGLSGMRNLGVVVVGRLVTVAEKAHIPRAVPSAIAVVPVPITPAEKTQRS
jgi:hypothetical protein